MRTVSARERWYALNMILTLVAICAFGVFVVRDFQDQGSERVSVATLGATTGPGATASSGGSAAGDTGAIPPGGAGAPAGYTGPSEGPVTRAGQGARGSAPPPTAVMGGSAPGGGALGAGVPQGRPPACVDGHLRIGEITSITGPLAMQTVANATAAYFKKVNAEGGIGGCQVDFTYLDDGSVDQQKAAADARELVHQDNVFALVGSFMPITASTTVPYLSREGVPVVGTDGLSLQDYNNPFVYSFAASPQGFGISAANEANRLGYRRIAVFYLDLDFTTVSFEALRDEAARNGQTVVYSNGENIASATYGTDVVAARNANPDVVINIMDPNSVVRELNAMSSNDWYPNLVGTTSSSDPIVVQQDSPWFSHPGHTVRMERYYLPTTDTAPEVQEWVQTEGRYFPGFDANSYAEGAWLAAKIFTDQARRLGSRLTRATLLAALNGLQNYHTGFTSDLTMTPDHGPNKQMLFMRWDGARFTQATPFAPW